MKTALILLASTMGFTGLSASAAFAQTAVYDTSVLKTGNVWIYEYAYAPPFNQTNDPHGYSGTRRFEITQRTHSGDSIVFRVAFRDSILRRSRVQNYFDSTVTITDSVADFVFRQNAFTPSVPIFAKGQAFTGLESNVVYRGDTLKRARQAYPAESCIGTAWENLEGIGRVYDYDRVACGNTVTSTLYQLVSFNGAAFDASAVVVALRSGPRSGAFGAASSSPAGVRLQQGRVLYGDQGRTFDLRGQSVRGGSAPNLRNQQTRDAQ